MSCKFLFHRPSLTSSTSSSSPPLSHRGPVRRTGHVRTLAHDKPERLHPVHNPATGDVPEAGPEAEPRARPEGTSIVRALRHGGL